MALITGSTNPDVLYGTIDADNMTGFQADDLLYGFDGNDILNGGEGDDILYGGSGDDTFYGGTGEDLIFGQSGNDMLSYAQASSGLVLNLWDALQSTGDAFGDVFTSVERFRLSLWADVLAGSARADHVEGLDGNDTLYGHDGNDMLMGGNGDDELIGGNGADTLNGGAGFDIAACSDAEDSLRLDLTNMATSSLSVVNDVFVSIEGYRLGQSNDEALATHAATLFLGGDGDDTLRGGNGADTLNGERGTDELWGGAGNDLLIAGDEDDPALILELSPTATGGRLSGGSGNDTLTGGNMHDSLCGDTGDDHLTGALGADTIKGGAGNDVVFGGAGNDLIFGGTGADTLDGGDGFDTLFYETAVLLSTAQPAASTGEARLDVLTGIERVVFLGAGSTYTGSALSVVAEFLAATGRSRPGSGAETLVGNGADTTVDYVQATSAVRLTADATGLGGGTGSAAGDRLEAMAQVTGSRFADIFTLAATPLGLTAAHGANGNDRFDLTDANLSLYGGGNNDTMEGSLAAGVGAVTLDGGTGNDLFTLTGPMAGMAGVVTLLGGAGNDSITLSLQRASVQGGDGADTIIATGGDLALLGGTGNDAVHATLTRSDGVTPTLSGGTGNDTLSATAAAGFVGGATVIVIDGGAGNDSLTGSQQGSGGALADHFVFVAGWGADTLANFEDGFDRLVFTGVAGLDSFDDLTITGSALSATVSFGAASILLAGLDVSALDAGDVIFQ